MVLRRWGHLPAARKQKRVSNGRNRATAKVEAQLTFAANHKSTGYIYTKKLHVLVMGYASWKK